MGKWDQKHVITRFPEPVPCPFRCEESFKTSYQLALHVLRKHNFRRPEE